MSKVPQINDNVRFTTHKCFRWQRTAPNCELRQVLLRQIKGHSSGVELQDLSPSKSSKRQGAGLLSPYPEGRKETSFHCTKY